MTDPIPQHSSESVEWYTPRLIALMARAVMGGIDLDPCSNATANAVIEATRIFAPPDDGLELPWAGRVFLNPPGGKQGASSSAARWWRKLVGSYPRAGSAGVTSAIVIGFNPSILFTAQYDVEGASPTDWPVCYPRRRISFWREGVEAKNPPHHSVVIGYRVDRDKFAKVFGKLGKVVLP